MGIIGDIFGGINQSNAATQAASVQAQAAEQAAQLQYQEAEQALGFGEQQYANTLGLEQPFYESGNAAMGTLDQLMGLPAYQANLGIFSNPFGANGPPTEPSVPGIGSPNLAPIGTTGGQSNFVPMQQAMSAPTAAQGASSLNNGMLPLSSLMTANPQQQAAAIEGFAPSNQISNAVDLGGTFRLNQPGGVQGGPVGAIGQQPVTLPLNGNPGSGSPLPPTNGPDSMPASGSPAQTSVPSGAPGSVGNTGLPAGFLDQTWNTPFVAPTAAQAAEMPGYQFQLQQGEQALQNSAAATGGLLSGATAKAMDQYSQGLAQTDYNNLYNQALTQYQQAYNIFNQNQANVFNRYAALAGIGQTTAGQLSSAGSATSGQLGNILLGSGQQIGGDLQNAAAATASGYVGSANALSGMFSNLSGDASLLGLLGTL